MRNCASRNLEIPGSMLSHRPGMTEAYGGGFAIGLRCASAATVEVPIGPRSS
jgi:hypothetical protein